MGNEESQRKTRIRTLKETKDLIILLRDHVSIFTWSYEDMPELDTNNVVYKVPLEEGCKPIKQKLRRTHP